MYVIAESQLHKRGLDEIYKIVCAEYRSVHVDYLFLRERRREVSKKIKKICETQTWQFLRSSRIRYLSGHLDYCSPVAPPNEIYCFPYNVFLVRIDLGPI